MRTPGHARSVRVALAGAAGVLLAAALGAPAAAHVEVAADKPQAGARDVTITFTSEGESGSSGIRSQRVVLPTGINPVDVRLAKAPKGWRLTPAADGFTVAGPALRPRQSAVFSVRVAQLPATATELAFRFVDTYSDGKVSRWIEVPQAGQPEPDNPAPVLKLRPAAVTTPTATASAAVTPSGAVGSASPSSPSSAVGTPTATGSPAAAPGSAGSTTPWLIAVAAVGVLAAAGAALVLRRRRRAE